MLQMDWFIFILNIGSLQILRGYIEAIDEVRQTRNYILFIEQR